MIFPARRLKICLLGQPFWANRMRRTLIEYAGDEVSVTTLFPQQMPSRVQWRQVADADLLMRIGFRPGAMTPLGILFDTFWSMLRRVNSRAAGAYYWIGTDVLNAVREVKANRTRAPFWRSFQDIHIADAPWLVSELQEAGLAAKQIHFPSPILKSATIPDLPKKFSVLTYIPERRYRFYAGPAIAEAARRLPHIQFKVVAGTGQWLKAPLPNLEFLGWQSDMAPLYRDCTVLLRMLEHDALGATVQEGLCFARHVIYTYPVPFTNLVNNGDVDGLVSTLSDLYARHELGTLRPNIEGWRYGMTTFSEAQFTAQLVTYLRQRVKATGVTSLT